MSQERQADQPTAEERLRSELAAIKDKRKLSLDALERSTPWSRSSWRRFLRGEGAAYPDRETMEAFCKRYAKDGAGRLLSLWEEGKDERDAKTEPSPAASTPASHEPEPEVLPRQPEDIPEAPPQPPATPQPTSTSEPTTSQEPVPAPLKADTPRPASAVPADRAQAPGKWKLRMTRSAKAYLVLAGTAVLVFGGLDGLLSTTAEPGMNSAKNPRAQASASSPDGRESSSAGQEPGRSMAPRAKGTDGAKPAPAASTESGGVEGNHRCGRTRSAGVVSWTPCTLITKSGTMSFRVQFTNTSGKPVTVKVKLAYVQAAVEQTCPGPWGTSVKVTLPAKETKTSPLEACTASLTPAQAFQARGWVVPDGVPQWGQREHSPTLHVKDDGTPVWADEV